MQKNINPREPEEISKNVVDVNEKVYTNTGGCEDKTLVKIVNCVENSEGHNYQQTTTKGIKWEVNANIGLQFGLPQVGVGGGGELGANYGRSRVLSVTQETTNKQKVEQQSHHEESLAIPPGKKAILRMISYRVRYKIDYTMEYRVSKLDGISVRIDACGLGLCFNTVYVTASQLLQTLPGYREDDEFVYFSQEGVLRWIANRMEVKKTIVAV